jgi:hypothetical protein
MKIPSQALSTADKAIVGITAAGGVALVVYLALPMLFDVLAPLDAITLPAPLNRIRVGSVMCGLILGGVLSAIPTIYKAQCDRLRAGRDLAVYRD